MRVKLYEVGQNIRLGVRMTSYGKTQMNLLANQKQNDIASKGPE